MAVPEGLDLDVWIVPEAKPVVHTVKYENTGEKKNKKDKKGKAKENGSNNASKRGKKNNMKEDLAPMTQEEIDAAEERAKVIIMCFAWR